MVFKTQGGIVNKVWNKFEFKYQINAGEVECFFQPTVAGTVFHVSYRVIRGDDITVTIIDPKGTVVFNEIGQPTSSYQMQQTPFDGTKLKASKLYSYTQVFI